MIIDIIIIHFNHNSSSASEKSKATKAVTKYTKQLAEKINSVESDKDAAINEKQALSGVLSTVKADKNRLLEQNEQLLAKVKELEERPVDVTVATSANSEEIEKISLQPWTANS